MCGEIGLEKDPTLDSAAEIADEPAAVDLLAELVYEGIECKTEGPLPEGVKRRADGVAVYDVEEDVMLHQGRDEHWEVMSQESAGGSDDEDEDDEVITRQKDLAALRGDWLPDEDDSDDGDFECNGDLGDDEEESQGADGPLVPRARLQRKCTQSQALQGSPETSAPPGFEPAVGFRGTVAAAVGSGGGGCIARGNSHAQILVQTGAALNITSLGKMSVSELRQMCQAWGIEISGSRKQPFINALVARGQDPC